MGAVEGEGEEGGRRRREEGVVERGGVGRGEKGEVVEVERGTSVVRDDVREGCVDEEGREISKGWEAQPAHAMPRAAGTGIIDHEGGDSPEPT